MEMMGRRISRWSSMLIALLLFAVASVSADVDTDAGLYMTNSTHILYTSSVSLMQPVSIYSTVNAGRIVGLAVDGRSGYIFWSDISAASPGIHRGKLNGAGSPVTDVTTILDGDETMEINGLAVDWVSKHIYWTDGRQRLVQVANYDGQHRRLMPFAGLLTPRGIYADPIDGWLYWGDQGSRRVERSRLDGSERSTIASGDDVVWPNQLVVQNYKLYWVDAWTKNLMCSDLKGNAPTKVANLASHSGDSVLFGLTFRSDTAYVTVWDKGLILAVSLNSRSIIEVIQGLGYDAQFSLTFVDAVHQTAGDSLCRVNNGGCSHLCLPTGPTTRRCSCPSFGGLTLASDALNCRVPTKLLFYALGDEGQVGYVDLEGANTPDRYLVGRSLRPVAVSYDPLKQVVYWSDVHERTVHRAAFDGSNHEIFLNSNHSLGVVDGLAVDHIHGYLYYSNMGQILVEGTSFAWHKIEMIGLDGQGRKTIYNLADRPRALWIDHDQGFLYHTDWGSEASVRQTNLDGSEVQIIQDNLDNPNGLALLRDLTYVIDSREKTRDRYNPNYPTEASNATLYVSEGAAGDWSTVSDVNLKVPFGLAADDTSLYISDWGYRAILKVVPPTSGSDGYSSEQLLTDVGAPMGLFYSLRHLITAPADVCESSECEEICIAQPSSVNTACECNSYDDEFLAADQQSCSVAADFLLVADMNGVKMLNLADDEQTVNTVVTGSSYFSNMAAITYDPDNKAVYFSDVNSRLIYHAKLDGSDTRVAFKTNNIIEALVLDSANNMLYLTDYLTGVIARLDLTAATAADADTATDQTLSFSDLLAAGTLVSDLSQPRGLRLDSVNGYIYWTEWGSTPSVSRAPIGGSSHPITVLVSAGLQQPNALYLDIPADKLYIGDAGVRTIFECTLDGENCHELSYITNQPLHIYDLYKYGDWLLYTDWYAHDLNIVSMTTGHVTKLMQGLMRPTQMFLQYAHTAACPSDHSCLEACLPYPGGYQCACNAGSELSEDGAECIEVPGGWEETQSSSCTDSCPEYSVCATQAGTVRVACQCRPGYYPKENNECAACGVNKYKPYLGPGECVSCPAAAVAVMEASSSCQCAAGLVWNWQQHICEGTKPGECPDDAILAHYNCTPACTSDGECPGAQKCCQGAGGGGGAGGAATCPQPVCVDPTSLDECVYNGHAYQIGDSFKPNTCMTCMCPRTKTTNWRYGYASCRTEICNPLPCSASSWIQDAGECCPRCPEPESTDPINILNCPDSVITLQLESDKAYASFQHHFEVEDDLHLQREIIVTQTPNATRFWWIGPLTPPRELYQQAVRVEAVARNPAGYFDIDTCLFNIYVADEVEPKVVCPGDVETYTKDSISEPIIWPDAVATDNVGLRSDPAPDHPRGSTFPLGDNKVVYSVLDNAGNEGRCVFEVKVEQLDLDCPVPAVPNNGRLECLHDNTTASTPVCVLYCHVGYDVSYDSVPSEYTCRDSQWKPSFPEEFSAMACVEVKSMRYWVNGTVQFTSATGLSEIEDVEAGFEEKLRKTYLDELQLETLVHLTVVTDNIAGGRRKRHLMFPDRHYSPRDRRSVASKRFRVHFTLEGPEDFTSPLIRQDFQRVVSEMTDDVSKSEFQIEANWEFLTADPSTFTITDPVSACGPGEEHSARGCVLCAAGTYLDSVTSVCTLCPANTYSERRGQTSCTDCPDGRLSHPGAFSEYHCGLVVATAAAVSNDVIIGAAVGACALVLCIIIVIVLVVVVRRVSLQHRRKAGSVQGPNGTAQHPVEFANQAYVEDDPYSGIPPDKISHGTAESTVASNGDLHSDDGSKDRSSNGSFH